MKKTSLSNPTKTRIEEKTVIAMTALPNLTGDMGEFRIS